MRCHRIYNAQKSINILLKPSEAIKIVNNITRKVNLLIEKGLADEFTLKLWSTGSDSLKFGFERPKVIRKKKLT